MDTNFPVLVVLDVVFDCVKSDIEHTQETHPSHELLVITSLFFSGGIREFLLITLLVEVVILEAESDDDGGEDGRDATH